MPVQICRSMVQKLTHESPEIRLRTLEQIESKIERALSHYEEIDFKPGELFKQFIRWFGYQPLQGQQKVLQLMLRLLRSSYGEKIIAQLGIERLTKEMGKVKQILKGQKSTLLLVEQVLQYLSDYKHKEGIDEIIEITDSLSIGDTQRSQTNTESSLETTERIECPEIDYEIAWSKPTVADYNSMKFIAEILINPLATSVELQNALQHLQITMSDYPAEYMLQAPHIFQNLLQLYDQHEEFKCPLEDIVGAVDVFLRNLQERLQMRRKCLIYSPPLQGSNVNYKNQLKIGKALELLMNMCVKYFRMYIFELRKENQEILSVFYTCLDICRLEKIEIKPQILEKLIQISKMLRERCDEDEHCTLQRMKYLLMEFLLQNIIETNFTIQDNIDTSHFISIMHDYTIKYCYPERYDCLKELLLLENKDFKKKCQILERYEQEFSIAIEILQSPKKFTSAQIIAKSHHLHVALEMLDSLQLVEILFNAVINCLPHYLGNNEMRQNASNLLLKLLSLSQGNLSAVMFTKLAQTIKKHFACLMNGEAYCNGLCNRKLLERQIIGVPLSTDLLLTIANQGFENSNMQIRQNCEDILLLILKSQYLLGAHWMKLLEILLPIVPLLQCYTFSTKITDALLKLFDPDERKVPFLAIIQGNIRFLFHPSAEIRGEALTRLIYMVNSMENASQYVPNIMEVSDLLPNDLCLLQVPREFMRIFSGSEALHEPSMLHNLLALLDSTDIEPLIRKTTLMQLNVMCQNWDISLAICHDGAYYFALHALENSLRKVSYEDYVDTAIPAIGIISKLLFCDAEFRQELAGTENIYILILRTLFLYANDIQVRQDATVCLFQLLFSTFLIVPGKSVEVPKIMANLQMPLKCQLRSHEPNQNIGHELSSCFENQVQEFACLRQLIAANFCSDLLRVNNQWLEAQKQYDFSIKLHFTQRDCRLVKATNPVQNLRRFLKAMSNSTEHTSLINAAISLRLQLILHDLPSPLVPSDIQIQLLNMMNKFIQMPPGNEMDFLLFEQMLEVCDLCISLNMTVITQGIFKTLQTDFHHAFILLLQNPDIPLRLYRKLSQTLLHLLESETVAKTTSGDDINTDPSNILFCNLFELLVEVSIKLFESRDLQRVRCLLSLMQPLRLRALQIPDKQLYEYSKRFLSLSVALKSFTQTGAQWQRDCLQLVTGLVDQMKEPHSTFKLNASIIKYLSGLCGHNDFRVRTLSWQILTHVSRFKDDEVVGAKRLIDELSYLPGGFLACCLSTLLDDTEVIVVRQVAGLLFAELLPKCSNYKEATALLEQHAFFRVCHASLSQCELNVYFPENCDFNEITNLVTCEIISCFCKVCIEMIRMQRTFVGYLCEKPFMYRLYEVVKIPVVEESNAYHVMCADICQLYSLCHEDNFVFLQRTICRDQVWLRNFCFLLDKKYLNDSDNVNILKVLLVICKDPTGFHHICENLAKDPEIIVRVFMHAFMVTKSNTSLQSCSLEVLKSLLIKSNQLDVKYEHITFAQILERPIEWAIDQGGDQRLKNNDENNKLIDCNDKIMKSGKETKSGKKTTSNQNKSNIQGNRKKVPIETLTRNCEKIPSPPDQSKKSPTELIFIELYRLFCHLYPIKSCKFENPPSNIKHQTCETIAVLLEVSPLAQQAAENLKFLEKLLNILNTFLEEFNTSCTTFVRRYGEQKKMAVIKNFLLLFNIIMHWFSKGTAKLTNELQILELSKILIQIWPWLAHSMDLKALVLKMSVHLSQHSNGVCKQFSSLISSYANSILQLIVKIVTFETNKIKASSSEDFPIISSGLHIIRNCCTCPEGRSSLVKLRILDIFDGLHPFNPKSPKLKLNILHSWLEFWEVFTRYPEGAQARNINSLCAVVNKSKENSTTRILALKILRNMCFSNVNRTVLISSTDFMYTVNEILSKDLDNEPCKDYEEQFIASVAIWKLISGGIKFVAMIRGTKLAKKFKILHEHLTIFKADNFLHYEEVHCAKKLHEVLETIFKLFNY